MRQPFFICYNAPMVNEGRKNSKSGILIAALILVVLGAALYFAFSEFDLGHKLELMTYKRISTSEDLILKVLNGCLSALTVYSKATAIRSLILRSPVPARLNARLTTAI